MRDAKENELLRAKIEADIERYLDQGGSITEVESGYGAIRTQLVANKRSPTHAKDAVVPKNVFTRYVPRGKL